MALKMDRQIDAWELRFYLDEVAEAGVIVSYESAGEGVALDDSENKVTVAADADGSLPVGVLLSDVIDVDLSREQAGHIFHRNVAVKGDKVTLARKGWVVTDQINEGVNGSELAGKDAVLSDNGKLTTKEEALGSGSGDWDPEANPLVGRFVTNQDDAGFATVYIDL